MGWFSIFSKKVYKFIPTNFDALNSLLLHRKSQKTLKLCSKSSDCQSNRAKHISQRFDCVNDAHLFG